MAGGVADVFQVVVLAAGAHALLGGRSAGIGALVEAQEHILELVHPCVGEEQGGVTRRYQGTGSHHCVALGGEKVQKGLSNLFAVHSV